MIVSQKEYNDKKQAFLRKHRDFKVYTDPMDEYGGWSKQYICEDGAQLIEVFVPSWQNFYNEDIGLKVEVKCLESEQWNTDDSRSVKCYDLFDHTKRGAYE